MFSERQQWFAPSSLFSICQPVLKPQLHTTVLAEPKTGVCSTFTTKQACPKRQGLIRRHQNLSYIQHLTSMVLCYLLSALHNVQCTYPHCGVLQGRQQTTVAGPLLRFWLRIGLDKSLQDWIFTKVRKHQIYALIAKIGGEMSNTRIRKCLSRKKSIN